MVSLLSNLQLNTTEVQDIVKISKSGNYQIACQKHFDITHPGNQQMDLKVVLFLLFLLSSNFK